MGNLHLRWSIYCFAYTVLSASGQISELRLFAANVIYYNVNASIPFRETTTNYVLTRNGTLAYSVNGLWTIEVSKINGRTEVLSHNINVCETMNTTVTNGTMVRITRIGDSNMATNKLLLFPNANLGEIPFEISGDRTSVSENVRAIVVQGSGNWTLYTGTNYEGSSTCVSPTADVRSRGWGITKLPYTGTVGSVRLGCHTSSNPTSTPRSTTPTREPCGSVQNKATVAFLFLTFSLMLPDL